MTNPATNQPPSQPPPTQDASLLPAQARAGVLLPLPLGGCYDYAVPEHLAVQPGDYVTVGLGRREICAVAWGPGEGRVADAKLKPVIKAHNLPPMDSAMRRFIDWVAHYNMAAPGAVLKMSIGAAGDMEPPKPVAAYTLKPGLDYANIKLTAARKRVIDTLADKPPLRASLLADEAGCSSGVVRTMADAGLLDVVEMRPLPKGCAPDENAPGPTLSPEQQTAANALVADVTANTFSATLLDGVTGAGKTEVYFEAIAAALKTGKQVLVLLPEIALTSQLTDRFAARFGEEPALWHSGLTGAQKRNIWHSVVRGEVRVVAGARSALFLPFADLGLIIVDEEHDSSYKQEEGVIYNARDMAVVRGHLGKFPVVLVSATPSLETEQNVRDGRYKRCVLPARHGGAAMPDVHIIDLRKDKPGRQRFIAPPLEEALKQTVEAGEQAMLFLNRRGYAPLTLCRTCGHRLQCPHCTAWLVEHRFSGRLMCHHCGHTLPRPKECPECGADEDELAPCGPGVERIAEEAAALLPDARIITLASDTVTTPQLLHDALNTIRKREADIIIGTQMIAKGHHFPMLTCVGVVDADLGLAGGDLRAAERTYQLLHQVAGRAGRAKHAGHVYLQSWNPDSRVIQALAAHDRDAFQDIELAQRQMAEMPPFGRLAAIIVSGPDEADVNRVAGNLARTAPRPENTNGDVMVLGPAPAPMALLRGKHRVRLLVKTRKAVDLQKMLEHWIGAIETPRKTRIRIDIDPQSFY